MRYVLALFSLVCGMAVAQTVYEANSGDGVIVSLYDQPCALKEVSNLPYRATWTEKGKTSEGCFAIRPDAGVVVLYFASDKTVGLAPISAFKKGTGV